MKSAAEHEPALLYLVAWLVLVLLTGVSVWSAFLGLGIYAVIIQYGIAATQAAVIFILFMRLKGPPSLKWLFAGLRLLLAVISLRAQHDRLRDAARLALIM